MAKEIIGTIIDLIAPPGSGKTSTATFIALRKANQYKDKAVEEMRFIEAKYIDYDFANLRLNATKLFLKYYLTELKKKYENQENNTIKKRYIYSELAKKRKSIYKKTGIRFNKREFKNVPYLNFYQLTLDYYEKNKNIVFKKDFERDYVYFFYVAYFKPLIVSNYPIYDKQSNITSTIIDFKWFLNQKKEVIQTNNYNKYLEPYTVYIFDEIDKDLSSYEKGQDSAVAVGYDRTLKMIRHLLDEKGCIIFCQQILSSLHKQVRDNADTVFYLKKKVKLKMPTISFKLIHQILLLNIQLFSIIFDNYLKKNIKVKESATFYNTIYKKNNRTATKTVISNILYFFYNLNRKMEQNFLVMNFSGIYADNSELTDSKKLSYKINLKDLSNTYRSRFFFHNHLIKLVEDNDNLLLREFYSSLDPNYNELSQVKSNFYNNFFSLFNDSIKDGKLTKEEKKQLKEAFNKLSEDEKKQLVKDLFKNEEMEEQEQQPTKKIYFKSSNNTRKTKKIKYESCIPSEPIQMDNEKFKELPF